MKIDAHHHFWHYNTQDYGWISDEMAVLRRDFLPADLKPELDRAGIDRVVSVQARQCIEETEWLLKLAEENDFIAGVVGWLPIASPDFPALLEKYAANPKLRAIRHVVQDEPDDRFILGEAFNRGIDRLLSTHLVYDILIFERHLPYAIEFVKNHSPEQVFVLDHIAKPKIAAGEMQPWADNLRKLAAFPNVYCKLSGLVTEADIRATLPRLIGEIDQLYRDQLGEIFKYVTPEPLVMRNSRGLPIFHFVCASDNKTAVKIAQQIINKKQGK